MKSKNTRKYILLSCFCILILGIISAFIYYQRKTGTARKNPDPAPSIRNKQTSGKHYTINVYSFDEELNRIVAKYNETHPEFQFSINAWTDGSISGVELKKLINQGLTGEGFIMDLYCVDFRDADQYIKGEYSQYACTYEELGIDVKKALKKAKLPQYIIDEGTNSQGEIIALPYYSDIVVFMYRRSIAKEVWGTDEPEEVAKIIGAGTEKWDKFIEASQRLIEYGYPIVPGPDDLSTQFDRSSSYEQNEEDPIINPRWVEYMDMLITLVNQGSMSDTQPDTFDWFNILDGKGDAPVFGCFMTADTVASDLLQYFLPDTSGDWALCHPIFPLRYHDFTGIMVNKRSLKKEVLGPLIEWITLDSSKEGLQYNLANGTLYNDNDDLLYRGKGSVISQSILKKVDTTIDLLNGQNINPIVYDTVKALDDKYPAPYDNNEYKISSNWYSQIMEYIRGEKDKETVIEDYKKATENISP